MPLIATGSMPAAASTPVTFSVSITDPNYAAGGIASVLGLLHDDGLQGDAVAGDKVYTLGATLPGMLKFQVWAGCCG